jgi:putative hydrolase of the HAD superfamily
MSNTNQGIFAIVTDLGNVLAPFFPQRFTKAFARKAGLAPDDVHPRYARSPFVEVLCAFETGDVVPDDFMIASTAALGFDGTIPASAFWPMYRDIFDVDRGVVAVYLAAMSAHPGMKIVACSDTDPVRWAHLDRLFRQDGLRLDGGAFSFDVRRRKPDRAMFVRASEVAGVPLEQCLFVDDLARNVSAASEAGMRAHWFDPGDPGRHTALSRVLEDAGIRLGAERFQQPAVEDGGER